MQVVGFEGIGPWLGASAIVDAEKAVVGPGKADPVGVQWACQLGMAVAVDLERKGSANRA